MVSLIGIYEYFENLYNHHFKNNNLNTLEKIKKINNLISEHEENIANPILYYLDKRKDLNLIGKKKIEKKNRAPTISFYSNNKSSKEISKILNQYKIATRNDNFYAWRCLKYLGIDTNDGVVRLSMTHYNNFNDTENVLAALKEV